MSKRTRPGMQRLQLQQVQSAIEVYACLKTRPPPRGGWLKLIRQSLGLTQRQQALRLGIAAPTLHKCEQSEAEERISLKQLRKLADGLDCDLVYALIPRVSLVDVVEKQAHAVVLKEVASVAHSMAMEDQRPDDERVRKQVELRVQELLNGRWSDLWR